MWEAHLKISKSKKNNTPTSDLFRLHKTNYTIPQLTSTWEEDAFDQMELLGFPLYSPFSIATEDYFTEDILAKDLHLYEGQTIWIKGYLIHSKSTNTSHHKKMFFGTFLDAEGNWLDTVHFPEIAKKYPFRGKGIYKVRGKVVIDYDCISIEANFMEKQGVIEDPRYSNLRAGETLFNRKPIDKNTPQNMPLLGHRKNT